MTLAEIRYRLVKGQTLEGVGLERSEGRHVIRGLLAGESKTVGHLQAVGREFSLTTGNTLIDDAVWRDIKFVVCDVSRYKLFGCQITNCVFDKCKCANLGLWRTRVQDVRFSNCNLRDFAPGGIDSEGEVVPNRFQNVEFLRCDMRGSSHSCEIYEDCKFIDCRLDAVDFLGAVFVNCKFKGRLRDVMFRSTYPIRPEISQNRLAGCDFTEALIEDCSFAHINLDSVMLPDDPDLVLLPRGPADLISWQQKLGKTDFLLNHLIEEMGAPSIVGKKLLLGCYSQEQIAWLVEIAKGI